MNITSTSTSNPSPRFPKDPDDPSPRPDTDSSGATQSGDTVDRVTQAEPAELKPEDVFIDKPEGGQPAAEPGAVPGAPIKPADPEELSPEELRLMADTMPGEGPGGD
jgi:hypothetical protein